MDEPIKYVIVRLDDIQELLKTCNPTSSNLNMKIVINRLKSETGVDVQNIVDELKATSICHACEVEHQEHNCSSIYTNHLGRRLSRLVDRANTGRPEYTQAAIARRKREALAKLRKLNEQRQQELELQRQVISEEELIMTIQEELVIALQCMMNVEINEESLAICNKLTNVVMRAYPNHTGGQVTLDNSDPTNPNVIVIQKVKVKEK